MPQNWKYKWKKHTKQTVQIQNLIQKKNLCEWEYNKKTHYLPRLSLDIDPEGETAAPGKVTNKCRLIMQCTV